MFTECLLQRYAITLMTVWVRRGTAMKTPRKASASDHSISCHQGNTIGPPAGFCCLFIMPSAGTMPTSPAMQWRLRHYTSAECWDGHERLQSTALRILSSFVVEAYGSFQAFNVLILPSFGRIRSGSVSTQG